MVDIVYSFNVDLLFIFVIFFLSFGFGIWCISNVVVDLMILENVLNFVCGVNVVFCMVI